MKPLTLPAAVGGGRHTFPPPASQEKDNAGSASAEAYSVGQRLQAFVDELKWLSAEGNFASLLVWSTQHDEEPTKGCRSHSSAQVTQPLCGPYHPPPPHPFDDCIFCFLRVDTRVLTCFCASPHSSWECLTFRC